MTAMPRSWRDDRSPDIDLGDGVALWFTQWAPDRDLNPQYADLPDVPRFGAYYEHPATTGVCGGAVTFDLPEVVAVLTRSGELGKRPRWQVESWEPLTLSPSLLCRGCGHHGFIRGGRWVAA